MNNNHQLIDSIYAIKYKITDREYQNIMNELNQKKNHNKINIHEYIERLISCALYINPPHEEKEQLGIGYKIIKNVCRICFFYLGYVYFK
tara:strand:- start:117 stop:386 length:270 start_codon:yes stop_codon:yes gene_type:complete